MKLITGNIALMLATQTSNACLIKLLLKSGGDVKIGYKSGITPVLLAVEKNFNKYLQLLIPSVANINTKSPQGETLLIIAA